MCASVESPTLRRLAIIVLVLALLAGTIAAFALTEALKLERSPLKRVKFEGTFSPTCACSKDTAHLAFRLRRADTLDALIVDAAGDPVRALLSRSPRVPGRVALRWDGRDDAGTIVPDGPYRLRLHFAHERRTIVVPDLVRVDTQAPVVQLVSVEPRTISPDGDGHADSVRIEFRSSERVRPVLVVDGAKSYDGRPRGPGRVSLFWAGTADGEPVPAGSHLVDLQARDQAGNRSEPTEEVPVRIRYVELASKTLRVARGGRLRFHVLADAARFQWRLYRAGHSGRPLLGGRRATGSVAVHLPTKSHAGRYVLRVLVKDHADEAKVIVRPRR
jgi:hypothetical protein